MGYNLSTWDFWKRNLGLDKSFTGIRIVEFGNQSIKEKLAEYLGIQPCQSRIYFKSLGFDCTTIDIIGGEDVLRLDLSKKITKANLLGQFDIVTNNGTSEHVEPFKNQYECFWNMHVLSKPGGLIIHTSPEYGSFRDHCHVYYTMDFFKNLATLNKYEMVDIQSCKKSEKKTLILACFRRGDCDFTQDREAFFSGLRYVKGNKYSKSFAYRGVIKIQKRTKNG